MAETQARQRPSTALPPRRAGDETRSSGPLYRHACNGPSAAAGQLAFLDSATAITVTPDGARAWRPKAGQCGAVVQASATVPPQDSSTGTYGMPQVKWAAQRIALPQPVQHSSGASQHHGGRMPAPGRWTGHRPDQLVAASSSTPQEGKKRAPCGTRADTHGP